MKKSFAKWFFALVTLGISGLVSCGGTGLGAAALLAGGATGSGELNGDYADASANVAEGDEGAFEDEDSGNGGGATSTTYYIDENGEAVEVAVDEFGDATAFADETVWDGDETSAAAGEAAGEVPSDADGDDAGGSGAQTESDASGGNNMTDESSEYGETDLTEDGLINLPPTIAKGDGDDAGDDEGDEGDPDKSCSSENAEAVSLAYESGSEHYMMMPEDDSDETASRSRKSSSSRSKVRDELLRQTGDDASADAIVFFPSRNLLEDGGADVTPVKCDVERPEISLSDKLDARDPVAAESAYAWQAMSGSALDGYEIETGALRLNEGRVELGERATSLRLTGASAGFRLNAADFGDASDEDDVIPYIIVRPKGI